MNIFADWNSNSHSVKVQMLMLGYRLTRFLYLAPPFARWLGLPVFIAYRAYETLLGCELPWKASFGAPLTIYHAVGLIVNPKVTCGHGCVLRHCTTLGGRKNSDDAPKIGDYVDIGSNSVVIGAIELGRNVKVGAGSVVTGSVAENQTVFGNPAKVKAD